jgi:acetyl esterase/lipase
MTNPRFDGPESGNPATTWLALGRNMCSIQQLAQVAALAAMLLPFVAAPASETNAGPASPPPEPPAVPKTTYAYKQVGGCTIRADIYRAGGTSNGPAIVWIHGGALISGNRGNLHPAQLRKYHDAGFTVISIDYRLAPETKLKFIIEDLRDAFKWLRQRGPELAGIDPHRIAVVGHSAGGYLALMSGFCVEPRPRAVVAFYGYGEIAGDWYSRPDTFYSRKPAVSKADAYAVVGHGILSEGIAPERYRFYLYCRQNGLWPNEVSGHDPIREPKAFEPFCPARNVTKQYPPTLLLHGDKDTDVPYEQSVLMSEMLERQNVEHRLITMTNRGHGFDGGARAAEDKVIVETFDQVIAFLKKHTLP